MLLAFFQSTDDAAAELAGAAAEGLTVVPWCPYARKWLQDHPDAAAAVNIDWAPPPDPS